MLTFENYSPRDHGVSRIYEIGATPDHPQGVAREIAGAFGHELNPDPNEFNLRDLIAAVGPAKELQLNIGRVQDALGTSEDAIGIARGWAKRSALLESVQRTYATGEEVGDGETFDLAVVTGGVRNWMSRRADELFRLGNRTTINHVLLAAGNRQMKAIEGPDVEEGMTESDYMETVIKPSLGKLGMETEVASIDSGVGSEVMAGAADAAEQLIDLSDSRIAVVSNAGAWPQNAGQFRRAVEGWSHPYFDMDGSQLVVVSDSFRLGTGKESTATHQNPFSAVGQIVRNLAEFASHREDLR